MSEKDGGPAFPNSSREFTQGSYVGREVITEGGMNLRDYFAGQALVGLISNRHALAAADIARLQTGRDGPDNLALAAYGIADSMLRTREAAND